MYTKYKYGAAKKGLVWDLSEEAAHALFSSPCDYCGGGPLGFYRGHSYQGIDRLRNSEGYKTGNVVPCCIECNAIKSNLLTADEARAAVRAIKLLRESMRGASESPAQECLPSPDPSKSGRVRKAPSR